jgi:3-hydroxybutyryl-CoA dehydrogenase
VTEAIERVGVAGAGTMGSGIAQLACLAGYETYLYDPLPEALAAGIQRVGADLERGAARERWTAAEATAATARLRAAATLEDLGGCDVVIEAAPERLALKRELFARLEAACAADAVLATNTSSLSVSDIAAAADRPGRIAGMHFFNPPALMKLVEVVAGERTDERAANVVAEVAERMGRTPVRCADAPGFIVNRCNRPFALESLRMLGEGVATEAQIDLIVREEGGYRMGPFELIDLIGVDTNLSVARSFYEQRPIARWEPHPIQVGLVEEGRLGRKSGRGFYEYDADGRRADADDPVEAGDDLRRAVLGRLLAQLVNEACFAVEEGVAAPDDVDAAMKLGLNHPKGPFEWARELGPETVLATLDRLGDELGPDRYGAAGLLRRWVDARSAAPPAE